MTNEQILKKAIEKAVKAVKDGMGNYIGNYKSMIANGRHYSIIFSHNFAKAFWGEKKPLYDGDGVGKRICLHCGVDTAYQPPRVSGCSHVHYPEDCDICRDKERDWQYHLKIMVLEKEPLKYLEKFL